MAQHVRDPSVYLNDKNIYDGLKAARNKATPGRLIEFARGRGLILSDDEPLEDLIRYISRLTHSWDDLQLMVDLVSTASRAEKYTTYRIPLATSPEDLIKVINRLREQHSKAGDEIWKQTKPNAKTVALVVSYTLPDFKRTAVAQLTQHTCKITFSIGANDLQVRYSAQERAEEILRTVIHRLKDALDQDAEAELIELSQVKSNRLRSLFFTQLIELLPGFRLVQVPTVRGSNGSLADKPSRVEQQAASAIQGAIKRVHFSGTSIVKTSEYRRFFGSTEATADEPAFHIAAIVWIGDDTERTEGIRAEFEARFSDQTNCSGFTYRVRKIWYRDSGGALRRTASHPDPLDEDRLMRLIETTAGEMCRRIKAQAGVTQAAPQKKGRKKK